MWHIVWDGVDERGGGGGVVIVLDISSLLTLGDIGPYVIKSCNSMYYKPVCYMVYIKPSYVMTVCKNYRPVCHRVCIIIKPCDANLYVI